MEKKRVHLIIFGSVQGVFFRASTQQKANELGLKGWVKNRVDGTVELTVDGESDKLKSLVKWCKSGPKHAIVDYIEVSWDDFKDEFTDFRVI